MRIVKNSKKSTAKSKKSLMGKGSLGVDITPNAIGMVHLSGSLPDKLKLEKHVIQPLPKGVIINGNVENHDQLVSYLQQAFEQLGGGVRTITAALPHTMANIQNLTYSPQNTELSLEEFAESEAGQAVGSGNPSFDYQVLAEIGNAQDIVLASARRDDVDGRVDLFSEAGISLSYLDIDTFAVVNSLSVWIDQFAPELFRQKIAVFHIEEEQTTAFILQEGKILYKQETNFGNRQLTLNIQRHYGHDEETAWNMRFKANKPADFQSDVADQFNGQLTQEVQRILQFYYTTVSSDYHDNVKHILISGCPFMRSFGLAEGIYAQTNIPTQQAEPVLCAQADKSPVDLEAGQLAVAFGLAVRGL